MKINVLVTGANGQLGKTIKNLFLVNDDGLEFTFVTKQELDISNKPSLIEYFNAKSFDYCINCAAYTNVEQAEESVEDAFRINSDAVSFLAECCSNSNVVLIHISTDYVFDGKKESPYLESDDTNPINEYGRSKLAGEKQIQALITQYFIIRTSWLYSQYPKNFVTTIASKIIENADLTITTSQTGTPTSCVELSKFLYWLILNRITDFGVYHFSAKGTATWYDFALNITEHFPEYNKDKITKTIEFKSKAQRPSYSVMDNSKVQSIYKHQNHWKTDLDAVVMDYLKIVD